MLVKCICTNCAGHLEFEEENVGEKIKCPHCGFETTLFLPGTEPVDPEAIRMGRQRKLRLRRMWLAGALIALLAIGYVGYRRVLPAVQDLLPAGFGLASSALVLLIGGWALLGLVLWVLFPVFVFFESRKIRVLLGQIEMNLRPASGAEPESNEDEEAEQTDDIESAEDEGEPNLTGGRE